MNRGNKSGGYTIVELLIFLAVSAVMFVSVMALVGGRQNRTGFQQSMANLNSELQDIANDVSTGYYSPNQTSGDGFSCNANASQINYFPADVSQQGVSGSCIFIGKAIKFNDNSTYTVFTLGGRRFAESDQTQESASLSDSGVKAVTLDAINNGSDVEAKQVKDITYGGEVKCVIYSTATVSGNISSPCSNGSFTKTDVITYATTFASETNRSRNVDLLVPKSPQNRLDRTDADVAAVVNSYYQPTYFSNPTGGVYVCVNSTGSNQYALFSIGGNGSVQSSEYKILAGNCG